VEWAAGAYSEARALFERALAIQEQALGPDHPFRLAQTLVATHGDRARALALAGNARAGYHEAGEIERVAEVEQFLAEQEVGP